ncbi:MAG: 50S ribosomal protein L3 [Negativicutes bacterium]|jgi:large subunit ribosomal protein L3
MVKGLIGKKLGMTQIFAADGKLVPVTVVEVGNNVVLQNKTASKDGYNAVQLGYGAVRDKLVTKPRKGFFAKIGQAPVRYAREIRMTEAPAYEIGQVLGADVFAEGELIDVSGVSKGKGFAGCIKRHNFHRGPMAHGSKSHREPGSIGPRMSGGGGKVFKGTRLPGHMGVQKVTIQRLTVARIDIDRNLILVRGAVPGAKGSLVMIRNTKKPGK